ncbi:peptidase S8/S53 domain-containing protein [Syncephalis pseudoplumigaleata]|uniref:Peptidase S8/S53 domain-containing protein n=1 Tax=Syncephalis pseudoplumigaleata TaxID=1712513 RepID=A0A4P9Z377_9FUNG|nr:peptidase S8/S53 domain-containing protein [Syncephalis pseudoplumigaleata]|eukprot:RKP26432.1 peptidase S8/S53 domain-containing protein [Syncephalis pseudoplumigaleata]
MRHPFIAALLCLLVAHGTAAEFANYQIANAPKSPIYVSQITGKSFSMMPYYHATGIDSLHKRYEYGGAGVTIAILDHGIDYKQYAFADTATQTRRIAFEHDFVGDQFDGVRHRRESRTAYARCNDHGTNMAGIMAAKTKTFVGIAPQARLGIYRVFGCLGPTSTSVVRDALRMATLHRADIITMPEIGVLGDAHEQSQLQQEIVDAAKAGAIMVAAATSNNYLASQQTLHFSYARLPVLSVGGALLPYRMSHWFSVAGAPLVRIRFTSPCSAMDYSFGAVGIVPLDALRVSDASRIDVDVSNTVILVTDRQSNGDDDDRLLQRYLNKGALGIVTTLPDWREQSCSKAIFKISHADAELINGLCKLSPRHRLVFNGEHGNFDEGGQILVDTMDKPRSYGTPVVKPDILAPSRNIFTTGIDDAERYVRFSGPSAAVAYMAGALALYKRAKRPQAINLAQIKNAFRSTATPVYYAMSSNGRMTARYTAAGLLHVESAIYNSIHK